MNQCSTCEIELAKDWNLAPIGTSPDGKMRIYEDDVSLCDDCYDTWCTKYNIQPMD